MDDQFKPISQSLQQLIESSNECVPSTDLLRKTDAETAVSRAKILAGCYRKDDAADPETYSAALAAVLAEYPPDIVRRVTDPRTGLPSRQQWLPTIKEVHDACDELDQRERRFAEAAKREREQLEARQRDAEKAKAKPTYDDLKAKYGPNWGLSGQEDEDQRKRKARLEKLEDANRRAFVAECEAAGFPADSQVSPSLAALIRGKRKAA